MSSAEILVSVKKPMTTSENIIIDKDTPLDILQQESEKGNPEAQFNLGCCYCFGEGVPEDIAEAVKWW